MVKIRFSTKSIVHLGLMPVLFLSAITPALACSKSESPSTNEHGYILTSNNQCLIYNPYKEDIDKMTWTGQCKDGYATGFGTASMYSKDKLMKHIDGEYQHGMVKNKAIMYWDEETECQNKRYEGEFKDGKPFGQGVTDFTDGNRYVGPTVARGTRYKGIFTWGENSQWNGDRYEGEFISGKRDGWGIYTSGVFEDLRKQGIVYKPEAFKEPDDYDVWEGYRYEGEWKDNDRNGKGLFISKSMKYDGQWKDNQKNGYGIADWFKYNSHYEGDWANDSPNGKGKITWQDGSWYKGDFLNAKSTGKGEYHYASGSLAVGQFIEGKRWGFATLTVPKSAYQRYADKRSPLGKWMNDNTFVEQGWFVDDKLVFSCQDETACRNMAKVDSLKQESIDNVDQQMSELHNF